MQNILDIFQEPLFLRLGSDKHDTQSRAYLWGEGAHIGSFLHSMSSLCNYFLGGTGHT